MSISQIELDNDDWVCVKEESLITVSIRDRKKRGQRRAKPKVLRMVDDQHAETFCLAVAKATGLSNYQAISSLKKQWEATTDPDRLTAELKHYIDLSYRLAKSRLIQIQVLRGSYAG